MRTSRSARGFGLIEVMISAALLAIGMAGIVSLFSNLEENYKHQRLVATALHIAEATMEDLLVRYADDAEISQGAHTGPSFALNGAPGGTFFQSSWQVNDGVPFSGVREVVVTVAWTERGVPKRLSLRTGWRRWPRWRSPGSSSPAPPARS
jgi:prepilin-type N-terminal cleavage/methylation domain-containing protein